MLCDDPEGWRRRVGVGGSGGSEGGDVCTLIADSYCCTAGTKQQHRSNYPPIKTNLKTLKKLKVEKNERMSKIYRY